MRGAALELTAVSETPGKLAMRKAEGEVRVERGERGELSGELFD